MNNWSSSNRAHFEILEKTGFHCPSERALKIYAEHGAKVDFENQIVKLPPDVVTEGVLSCTALLHHGGRTKEFDLDLSKAMTYEATDGTGTKTIDYITRELRSSIKDDVAKSARISDYLSIDQFLLANGQRPGSPDRSLSS